MGTYPSVAARTAATAFLLIAPLAAAPGAAGDLRGTIRELVAGQDATIGILSRTERTELQMLYAASGYVPLWLGASLHPTGGARDAVELLNRALEDGLDPAEYNQHLLIRLRSRVATASPNPREAAGFDVALSAGLLRYLRHLHVGRIDPRALGFRLDGRRDEPDFPALVRSAIANGRVVETAANLRPQATQYRALRAALAQYRRLARGAERVELPQVAKSIHPGDPYAAGRDLFRGLRDLGDLPADATEPPVTGRYEGMLVDGVRRFQRRHGLEPDGVLGKSTVAALRVPLSARIRQIELALERLRWLPQPGDGRMVWLNIPMFLLWASDAGGIDTPVFDMKAVVGRAIATPTPVLVGDMDEVIFRPVWNVPRSILLGEVLPRTARDPNYLQREGMEIVRGDADSGSSVEVTAATIAGLRTGVLRVRQRPGPANALGLIKFVFPNPEGVYMHGTPAQALFARSRRDFSHGCVRVADPVALAQWVLQDRPEWDRDRIVAATNGSQTLHVTLPRPITVIFFYTTAVVAPADGLIRFAEDIYRHDERLERALAARRRPPAPHASGIEVDEVGVRTVSKL